MDSQQAREKLLEAIGNSDRVQANAVLDAWAEDAGYERTLREYWNP